MEKLIIVIAVILLITTIVLSYQLKKYQRLVFFLTSEDRKTIHPNFLVKLGIKNLKKFERQIKEKYTLLFNLQHLDVFPEEVDRLTRHYSRLQRQATKKRLIIEKVFFKALSENERGLALIIFSLENKLISKEETLNILFKEFIFQNISLLGKEKIKEIIFRINFLNTEPKNKDQIDKLILLIKQKSPA